MTHKIKITDAPDSRNVQAASNGVVQIIPVGEEVTVTDGILDALTASSISFEMVGEGGGSEGGVLAEPSPTPPEAAAIHPLDHDEDGRKGGSKPKAQRKPRAPRKSKTPKE